MDLTSPRRSSRNHASTLALDVAMSVSSSLKEEEEERKHMRSDSVSSSTASSTRKPKKADQKEEKKVTPKGKRGRPPSSEQTKRRRKRSETEEESSEEEEDEEDEFERELAKQDFSVSRLMSTKVKEEPAGSPPRRRLDIPDDDALPFPVDVLFSDDALGKVDASQYPPNCTQFNIGGTKYLPLSCLMDEDGFTVSLAEPVPYLMTNGQKHRSTLADALKNSGISVKRRTLGRDLLSALRIAGLVVHWAFVGALNPPLLQTLQDERDKARKAHEEMLARYAKLQQGASGGAAGLGAIASEEVVKKTVAELIEERKRRSHTGGLLSDCSFQEDGVHHRSPSMPPQHAGLSTPPSEGGSTIFPVREYRKTGLEALARAASLRRENMTVHELMLQQMSLYQQTAGCRREPWEPAGGQAGGPAPLRISDPDHLNKFIGMLNGEPQEVMNPAGQINPSVQQILQSDNCPELSITEKILLISDYDGGAGERELAEKYRIAIEKVPAVIRLRVPLIREQTRMFMDKRMMRIKALPVRRTNFAGLNIMMWRFFKDCRDRGIALTGRQLKEHAMTIAAQLGLSNFKGSEGWLDAFKRRHKIDLRTMAGEAVNYESDPDGNIVCAADTEADEEEGSLTDSVRDSSSPAGGDNPTDQLLASVTAIVNNEVPVSLPMDGDTSGGEVVGGCGVPGSMAGSGGPGSCGAMGSAMFQPNYEDPRMQADYRLDEASLISNIIRSCAVHVPNPEVAHALDVLRSYIVANDPPAIGFFVDLQTRLAATISAQQMMESGMEPGTSSGLPSGPTGSSGLPSESNELPSGGPGGVGLLNGVGGMSDRPEERREGEEGEESTPPMREGESAEPSEKAREEKENEEKKEEKPEDPGENGTANSSHNSTTSEDSNED